MCRRVTSTPTSAWAPPRNAGGDLGRVPWPRPRTLHPDAPTGRPRRASTRFKVVSAAYRVLSDPSERARYDAGRVARMQPAPARRPRAWPPSRRHRRRPLPPQPTVLGWEMTRKRGHWVLGAGIACLVLALVVGGWVLADPNPGAGDQTRAPSRSGWWRRSFSWVASSRCGSRRTACGTPCAETAASVKLQSLQECGPPGTDGG